MNQMNYMVSYAGARHSRDLPKPNEDYIFVDESKGIFILLDGITRIHDEYYERPEHSAACDVNEVFTKGVYKILSENIDCADIERVLHEAVVYGNCEVKKYRSQKDISQWGYYPATLGIVSVLRDGKLYYACVGDCLGVLLRNNTKIIFGNQPAVNAVDLKKVSKKERYEIYCNHPKEHFSYTVFNGDDVVSEGIEVSFLDLHKDDTVLLVSDGLASCVKYEKNAVLTSLGAEEIIELSRQYDNAPYASYADDKSIIKICIK